MNEKIRAREMSFIDIFQKECATICVPSIQRDYAQGRLTDKATKVRKDFVNQLKEYILSDKSHSLDFIYGSQEGNAFIPLDGQQRLTTLWLLHVYLACAATCNRDEDSACIYNCRKMHFTYQTRNSSTRFCAEFLKAAGDVLTHKNLSAMVKDENAKGKERKIKPSELIENESWWFISWKDDPTVSGMLTMLDEIDKEFFDISDQAFESLIKNGRNPVVFEFLPLEGFHDIDDLYIKMNARGLPLTKFEIFKSKLIEEIENVLPQEEKDFKAKIDGDWSDTLWKFRNQNERNIDSFLQRILTIVLANEGAVSAKSKLRDESLDCLFEANGKKTVFAYNWYKQQGITFNAELLTRVIRNLNVLLDERSPIKENQLQDYDSYWFDIHGAVKRWILNGKDVAEDKSMTYSTRLRLFAFIKFSILVSGSDMTELTEWMRLIHNLSEASPINNSGDMTNALRGVESLLGGYNAWKKQQLELDAETHVLLNDWLADSIGFKPIFFYNDQWQEEVIKAQLRKDPEWKEEIDRAERHPYLNGQIGIILWLAGIIPSTTPFADLSALPDVAGFKAYLDKAYPLFGKLADTSSAAVKEYGMVRAMLSKSDYMPWLSSWRKNFYNRPGDRDYSWKTLFLITDKNKNGQALRSLKEIIDDERFSLGDIDGSLEAIGTLKDTFDDWRNILRSKYGSRIMKCAKQGFIAFDNGNTLIYSQSQRNHYHAELMTLLLFERLKEEYKLHPEYYSVKSGNDDSRLDIKGFSITQWNKKWTVWRGDDSIDVPSMDEVISIIQTPELFDEYRNKSQVEK